MTLPVDFHATAPPLNGPVLFEQHWLSVAFLHWAADPDRVAPLLPPGTRPDVFAGRTYVGLVAFRMHGLGFGRGLPLPYLGRFPEINVRLYSVDDHGHHGVVFRSLEATRLLPVLGGRWGYGVPYTWARMRVTQRANVWTYTSRRRMPRPEVGSDLRIDVGSAVTPTDLDVFLTARWGLHSRMAGRTVWTPNEHEPWPLHAASALRVDDYLVPAAGLGVLSGPPDVRTLWSPGVRTRFGFPRPIAG